MTAPITIGSLGVYATLEVHQGSNLEPQSVVIRNPDLSVVSMVGSVISGGIRKKGATSDRVVPFTISTTVPAGTSFTFSLPSEVTSTLTAGDSPTDQASQYIWSLRWKDSSGVTRTLFYGPAIVLKA